MAAHVTSYTSLLKGLQSTSPSIQAKQIHGIDPLLLLVIVVDYARRRLIAIY